jgi:hypothetical protein
MLHPKPTTALLFECRCILQNLDCSATATRLWKWPAICIAGYVTHVQDEAMMTSANEQFPNVE